MKTLQEILNYNLVQFKEVQISIFSILIILIILLVIRLFMHGFKLFIKRQFSSKNISDRGKEYTIVKLTKYVVYVIGIYICMDVVGINIGLILGASAALLVGVGLGLQNVFNDIVSGFILLFEGTFKVGDVIEFNNTVAKVDQIDIRTSKITTRDGTTIIVPNSQLVNDHIINWSHGNQETRFSITVGVAYGSDTILVRDLLIECAKSNPDVLAKKQVIVRFQDFGDSALQFELFFWAINTWAVENLRSELRFAIDKAFREHKVSIPFPQRDLHIQSDNTK
ncbi:MAG: small-conductance mechanosensitive channel [Flavobacteriales bacterium]|jgi:small-conductance mechanosensitive channel